MSQHRTAEGLTGRRVLVLGAALVLTAVVTTTTMTSAAFTDATEADLGAVGGSYDIALVDPTGAVVQGYPDPMVVETVVPGVGGAPAVEVGVVTTTPATGRVALTITNARGEALPPDDGVPGPGADPFDVVLLTVVIDGTVTAEQVPAHDLGPVWIDDWHPGVPQTVQVSAAWPAALGNPYYYGRTLVLGLELDGSTS